MAKRKRLTPADPAKLAQAEPAQTHRTVPLAPVNPPIAEVARDAAREAAMTEVAEELTNARKEGRLVQTLPLDAIEVDYLVRDRMGTDDDEMEALKTSIRDRGQQTPIDVITIEQGRYGLISGWRRLAAIKALFEETGEDQFASIKALNRTPETSSDAYQAMVEENEIRVGLSFYERARIALKAAEQGAYPTPKKAVLELFRSASRPKRSKIHSFLTVVQALDGALRFPTAIPERLGLRLAKLLEEDPGAADLLSRGLSQHDAQSADEETGFLDMALSEIDAVRAPPKSPMPAPREHASATGLTVRSSHDKIVITGSMVSDDLAARLASWLKNTLG